MKSATENVPGIFVTAGGAVNSRRRPGATEAPRYPARQCGLILLLGLLGFISCFGDGRGDGQNDQAGE